MSKAEKMMDKAMECFTVYQRDADEKYQKYEEHWQKDREKEK